MGYSRSCIVKNCFIKNCFKAARRWHISTLSSEISLWLLLTFQSSNVGKFCVNFFLHSPTARIKFSLKALNFITYVLITVTLVSCICPDKIPTFCYVLQNCFQVFWKGFPCQCMSLKDTMGRNDVRSPFFRQSCKT